jgi:hypothetical protein
VADFFQVSFLTKRQEQFPFKLLDAGHCRAHALSILSLAGMVFLSST